MRSIHKMNFETLPEFIIYEIVSRLNVLDRMNLKATCRRMYSLVGKRSHIARNLVVLKNFVRAELKGDKIIALASDHHLKMYDRITLEILYVFTNNLDVIGSVSYPLKSHFEVHDRYTWIHHMEWVEDEDCFYTRLYDIKMKRYLFGFEDPSYGDLGTWKAFDPTLGIFYGITHINIIPQLYVVRDDKGMIFLDYPFERDLYYSNEVLVYGHYLVLANYDYYSANLIFIVDLNTVSIVTTIKVHLGRRKRQYYHVETFNSYPLIRISSQFSTNGRIYNILTGELKDVSSHKNQIDFFTNFKDWTKINKRVVPKFPFGNMKSVEVISQYKRSGRFLVHGNIYENYSKVVQYQNNP